MSKDPVLWEIERVLDLKKQGKTADAVTAAKRFLDRFEKHPCAVQAAALWASSEMENPVALYTLGKSYLLQGDFQKALSGFNLALRLKQDMAEAWAGLGISFNALGDLARAMECAQKAVQINPRDVNAQMCVLDNFYNRGEFEKGLAHGLDIEKSFKNNSGVLTNIARFYKELGDIEKAKTYYQKAIKADPENLTCRVGLLVIAAYSQDVASVSAQLPPILSAFEKSPNTKKMMPVVWKNMTTIQSLIQGKPMIPDASVLAVKSLDHPDAADENFKTVDEASAVKLFEAQHINCFTTDTVYYTDHDCWLNHRFTGTDERFLMGCGINGKALIRPENDPIPFDPYGIYLGSVENYYHWLFDYLPRLSFLDDHPELQKLPIFIGDNITQTQLESLTLLGIGEDRLIRVPKHRNIRLDKVLIPYLPGRPMEKDHSPRYMKPNENPFAVKWLHDKFCADKIKAPGGKRYFLSRDGAKFRRLINEEAVYAIAQRYGFEKINNTGKTLREQIEIYSQAEALLGPHGAAFANMAFMENDTTTIFELFPMNRRPPFYETAAAQKNQRYLSMDGPIVRTYRGLTPDFGDFHIDEEKFAQMMAENFG